MYYEHFGLSGPPFEFNPSASALFMSAGHREGLAALEWGLREPSGFTMLVGEIGTGKTTLIYSLLSSGHEGVRTAWVANPRISFEEMLRQVLGQLGARQPEKSGKLSLLQAFDAQLASMKPEECVAVIIDEAQDLSDDALEDIRLLSNFQSLERRRLQIVLVGQIDLARRLSRPQLRELNQRIGARALLPTLRGEEIYEYIDYRIRSRGGDVDRLFTRGAIREVTRASAGIPRRINVLCHNSLFLAYADGKRCVGEQHVQDATRDYDHLLVNEESMRTKVAASASAAIASASTVMRAAGASMRSAAARSAAARSEAQSVASIVPTRAAAPAASDSAPMRPGASSRVRAMAVSVFLALCVVGIAGAGFAELQMARHDLPALANRFASQAARLKTLIGSEPQASQATGPQASQTTGSEQGKVSSVPSADESKNGRTASFSRAGRSLRKKRQPETSSITPKMPPPKASAPVTLSSVEKVSEPVPETAVKEGDDTETRATPTVLVRAGDTLSKIAKKLYGSFGDDEVSRLTAANPQIKDADVIYPGQTIRVQQATK